MGKKGFGLQIFPVNPAIAAVNQGLPKSTVVKNNALIRHNLCFLHDKTTCSVDLIIGFLVLLNKFRLLKFEIGAVLFFYISENTLFF